MAKDDLSRFPFDHGVFINMLFRECRGLRHLTASFDILHTIFDNGTRYFAASQCSLNKALERVCTQITQTFGQSVHYKYWKIAKHLCNHTQSPFHTSSPKPPHVSMGCRMTDLSVTTTTHDQTAWVIARETWVPSTRIRISHNNDDHDTSLRRQMNYYILEALVQHQLEYPNVWRFLPDYNVMFMALTFARRGKPHEYSATSASHFASIAVRYEIDEGRTGSSIFKGLRRWRNIVPDVVTSLTLQCVWGHKETPRHHQLWHFERLIKEKGIDQATTSTTLEDGIFLLLLAVINDHIFASIPPEDAADAVVQALFTRQPLHAKQYFDVSRIIAVLDLPRSPYLHLLFPKQASITTQIWMQKLDIKK